MSEERIRLFVALALPRDVREVVLGWRAQALSREPQAHERSSLRLIAAEALHVTLCFLGWQVRSEVDPIASACEGLATLRAAQLSLGEAIWLPPRRPRVLAIELADVAGDLARLQALLTRALSEGGWYKPEKRPFRAHLTVARAAGGARLRARPLIQPPAAPFVGESVVLFRSRLERSGARYEPLRSVRLRGAD